ncbi:MAG: HDOD domain-containing protein [Gammaproteobacteria bacterium]|nr:HDOD domain-containing protein [Gammaproteobacteria bacterium]
MGIKNLIDENELRHSLALIHKTDIPSPPQLLVDLKSELSLDVPDTKKIIRWISQDIGLASSVLKNINSPLYGLKEEVSSIEHAISLLGLVNLKDMIINPAYKFALTSSIRGFEQISEHSHYVGIIAELIGREIENKQHGLFYLAGLFHDAGALVIASIYPEYMELFDKYESHPATFPLHEKELYDVTHSGIGVLLAKKWGLPNEVCNAIYLHHHIYGVYKYEVDHETVTIAAVLKLANYLNHKVISGGSNQYSPECMLMFENAAEELMIDQKILDMIEEELLNL